MNLRFQLFRSKYYVGHIGATRESINKTLGNFRRNHYIRLEQSQITIIDPAALREISA